MKGLKKQMKKKKDRKGKKKRRLRQKALRARILKKRNKHFKKERTKLEEVINKARWAWHQNEFGHENFECAMVGGALSLNKQMDDSAIQAEWERTFVWIGTQEHHVT